MFSSQSFIKSDGITYSRLLNSVEKLVFKVKRLDLNSGQINSVVECLACLKNLLINLSLQYEDIPQDILNQVETVLINIEELVESQNGRFDSDSVRRISNMYRSSVDSPRTRESVALYLSPLDRGISPRVGSFTISPQKVTHSHLVDSESEFEDDEDESMFNRYQRNR